MSKTVQVQLQFKNVASLKKACEELGYGVEEHSSARLFESGQNHEGTLINIPGWNFPVIAKSDGTVVYDNYEGRWGDIKKFNALKKTYARIENEKELKRQGVQFKTVETEDGGCEIVMYG